MIVTNLKITPFLWFDTQAEEAARFYVSVFKNSRIEGITYYSEAGPAPKGAVMTVAFELDGQHFTALNGGPTFKFTEAVSFVVACETQQEVDEYWDKLSAGGKPIQCGWLKDKYGLAWQIVPNVLIEMLQDPDDQRRARVSRAMFEMQKLDIAALEAAHRSGEGS